METPICVIDAKTFVDHIQDLKNWIYSGHIRLIVPSCTIQQVEQLYQKSIEPKPTTQEVPRSRSLGKPPKKEYPAFDINPRVAREYLGRLKNRKEQDADSEQRAFFQEKENHEAVRFQHPNEQYTPWKDLDLEAEKPEAIEGPPTSWAEALRRKQNLANGSSEQSVSKAPAKPKLVARAAGSEPSPWKVKKDAPKISAKDVPGVLRPLMSCALWRLHESIERNDPNQLFLLSDQTEMKSVAQKLNIIVKSCSEVGATIASKTCTTDLDTFGDLEREFGVPQKIAISLTQDAEEANGKINASENTDEDVKDVDTMNRSVTSEGSANTEASSIVHEQDLNKQVSEHEGEKVLVNCDHLGDKVKEQDFMVETAATLVPENVAKTPATSVETIKGAVDSISQPDSQDRLSGSINGLKLDAQSQTSMTHQPALEHTAARSPPDIPSSQPLCVESAQRVQEIEIISGASSPKETVTQSNSTVKSAQEPEDSDEEVVVFIPQPKRLSAQQKPVHQSSRPSTPKEQSQQKPAGPSPQRSLIKPQPKAKAARHSPKPSIVGHAHPQAANSPTVIDPDAFGRDYRVNLNPSPRLPHNPNGHSNRRMRGNMQNSQVSQIPRSSTRQHTRTSPPRNATQENSRRLTPASGLAQKDTPNHIRQASRTSSGRGPSQKGGEEVISTDVDSRPTMAADLSKSQFPGPQMVGSTDPDSKLGITRPGRNTPSSTNLESNVATPHPDWNTTPSTNLESETAVTLPDWNKSPSTEFVPRSALSNADSKPGPRIYEASEFIPRPPKPVREFKPRAPKPKVFEAAEFVPRDFVPRTTMSRVQPKQYSPEPESIEPRPSMNDVDYVLKSGSTRASARGKGRLWTPS